MIIIKKEKIVHGIKIVKNRDIFLQDKNRFERTEQEQLWAKLVMKTNSSIYCRRCLTEI